MFLLRHLGVELVHVVDIRLPKLPEFVIECDNFRGEVADQRHRQHQ